MGKEDEVARQRRANAVKKAAELARLLKQKNPDKQAKAVGKSFFGKGKK